MVYTLRRTTDKGYAMKNTFKIFQNDDNLTVMQRNRSGELKWLMFKGDDSLVERLIREFSNNYKAFNDFFIMDDAEQYQDCAMHCTLSDDFEDVTHYYFGNTQ